jgi:ABC-type nitrate/sulfonate/bicarbonate transport system substrate-binding protein
MSGVKSITMYAPPGALPAGFALENGYFGQTGFDRVLLQPYTDANDMSPLLEGQADFLVAGWSTAAQTVKRTAVNLLAVMGFAVARSGWCNLLVLPESGYSEPEDLIDVRIGVPGLGSTAHELIWDILGQLRVDRSRVQFLPITIFSLGSALAEKQVDAICLPDPYCTTFRLQLNARVLVNLFDERWGWQDQPQSAVWTTCNYARKNPDTVSAFHTAIEQGIAYVNRHPDEAEAAARAMIARLPGIDHDGQYVFNGFDAAIDERYVQRKLDVHYACWAEDADEQDRITAAQLIKPRATGSGRCNTR